MTAVNFNHQKFNQALSEGKVILVDYWAPWCGYCRRIGPAYEKIAEEFGEKLIVAKVNIDEEPLLAHEQNIEVIPTLILYKDGKVLNSMVAPESKAAIEAFIHENLG